MTATQDRLQETGAHISRHGSNTPSPPAPPAAEHPKRLTLSAILELMLTRPAQGSYVSLARAANGGVAIDVKVSAADAGGIFEAEQQARTILASLEAAYAPLEEHANASVSLTRNAKGETQIDITGRTSAGTPDLEELAAAVARIYDEQRRAYPMANGLTAKPGSVA